MIGMGILEILADASVRPGHEEAAMGTTDSVQEVEDTREQPIKSQRTSLHVWNLY